MLKGVTTTPDDYLCEDGELAGAMGVENTDGGITGVSQHGPEKVMKMASGNRVVYEHKVKPAYNWIIWDEMGKTVGYVKDNTEDGRCVDETGYKDIGQLRSDTMPGVEAIGNTLMVRCSEDGKNVLHYVLWKPTEGEEGEYKYLGTHIPELALEFGLGIDYVQDFERKKHGDDYVSRFFTIKDLPKDLSVPNFKIEDGNKAAITSAVMASINKTQHEAMNNGYFVQPFLVRYAYKMYDGSTTMASVPVYMPVTSFSGAVSWPLCVVDRVQKDELWFHTEHVRSKLRYRVLNSGTELAALREWSDIIKGVEICVSQPLYTYNPAETISKTYGSVNGDTEDDFAGTKLIKETLRAYGTINGENLAKPEDEASLAYPAFDHENREQYAEELRERRKPYKGWLLSEIRNEYSSPKEQFDDDGSWHSSRTIQYSAADIFDFNGGRFCQKIEYDEIGAYVYIRPVILMLLPEKTMSEYTKEVKECSRFYKVSDMELKDLKPREEFVDENDEEKLEDVSIDKGVLNALAARPMLEDEYRSHDQLSGNVMSTYNARLNLADVTRTLWTGFYPEMFMMHYDERRRLSSGELQSATTLRLAFIINEGGQEYVVKSADGKIHLGRNNIFPYFYYPNTHASKLVLEIGSGVYRKEFILAEHTGLNGALHYTGDMNMIGEWYLNPIRMPAVSKNLDVHEHNKIYTSEAENPWLYRPTTVNTVGNDKILGMGAVTTALSQGQHGSFPMYCFTTEGIWSLSVNSTGGWSTSQTVTRDVMKEGTPILLIDDAIIFMSGQGMMMLQGDHTTCMTYDQKKRQTIKASSMAGLMKLIRENTLTDFTGLITEEMTDEEAAGVLTSDMMSYMEGKDIGLYYDYVNQRTIMGCYGTDTKPMSWLYYLSKRQWTVAPWKLMNRVNTYPECYAMLQEADGTNYMVRLDSLDRGNKAGSGGDEESGKDDDIMLLTRPMKLGEAADMLKELENVKVEGRFEKSKLGMAVWGTRDYKHWHLVGSCKGLHLVRKHGSGYLAFVLAIVGKLGKDDYLDSLTVEYQPRYGQKLHGMGYKE